MIPPSFEHSTSSMTDRDWDTRSVDTAPSLCLSDVSSVVDEYSLSSEGESSNKRLPLQWEFKGLTLWLEPEEFNNDLTKAISTATQKYGIQEIPKPHATAIYGMTHLSEADAKSKLRQVLDVLGGSWPALMDRPVGIKQGVAQAGRPGEVCSISWAELTLSTNEHHERALGKLYEFFEIGPRKGGPWTPHLSVCYDNPEDTVLSLVDFALYATQHPTLLTHSRKVKALSLWKTEGKLAQWQCLERVVFE